MYSLICILGYVETKIQCTPFTIKNNQDVARMRSNWNKTHSFLPIVIMIANQTKPPLDLDRLNLLEVVNTHPNEN